MRRLIICGLLLVAVVGVLSLGASQPRDETLIVDVLSGRAIAPHNFNTHVEAWRTPDRGVQQLMLEPLWIVDYVTGEVINALAKEGPIYNEDFTKMTVKLREGMYWSDGVEITAEDIVYGVKLAMETPGMGYGTDFKEYVDQVYKDDDHTVVFELKKPNSRFQTVFLDRWGAWRPFPKHIFEKAEDPVAFKFNPPVSSGPYVLEDYDPGGFWTLWKRREDWKRTPTGVLYGKPKPRYVKFVHPGPPTKKVMAQKRHELDMAQHTIESLKAAMELENVRPYRKKFPWVVDVDPCMTGITLQNDRTPYNLKDVRWALALSIDIVKYMGLAYDGAAKMGVLGVPPTSAYTEWYYEPLQEWLKEFTLDIEVDGEPFKPYDPKAPLRLAEYAKERGYPVPEDPDKIRDLFGLGWWKYAPDVAEKLLKRNDFYRDDQGRWRLPDGTLWKIEVVSGTSLFHPPYKNGMAAVQQWSDFGIKAVHNPTEQDDNLAMLGDFDAHTTWPFREPWGGHPDLYRSLRVWTPEYHVPEGEMTGFAPGWSSRFTDERMGEIVDQLGTIGWNDPKVLELGREALKIAVKEMPTIPTFLYPGTIAWDGYYWTHYPGAENPYQQPYHHWPNFKYMLPFLEPTGRE